MLLLTHQRQCQFTVTSQCVRVVQTSQGCLQSLLQSLRPDILRSDCREVQTSQGCRLIASIEWMEARLEHGRPQRRIAFSFSFLPPLWCVLTLMVFTYLFRCLNLFCDVSDNVSCVRPCARITHEDKGCFPGQRHSTLWQLNGLDYHWWASSTFSPLRCRQAERIQFAR